MFSIFEGKIGILQVLHELHGIIGGFAFAIRGHHKDDSTIFRNFVQVLEIVFFRITDERGETIARFSLFGNTNGILLGGSRLRAVKDDQAFLL